MTYKSSQSFNSTLQLRLTITAI